MFKNLILTLTLVIANVAFATPEQEATLKGLNLSGDVRMTIGSNTVTPKFKKMTDLDQKTVEADIQKAPLNLIKISAAYMSDDSVFVITFAKTADGVLKRYVRMTDGGKSVPVVDDITDVSAREVKSTRGTTGLSN